MSVTYTKLRDGSWGVRVTGPAAAGEIVQIQKRDGTTCEKTINRVVWSDGKTSIATLAAQAHDGKTQRSSYSSGSRAPAGRRCDYCGARDCPRAWDPRALCDED